ncbi:MAG TPA: PEP-CTERM sorting domain-containing protein [Verrucomicrobiae bacterium]|nr:PEP-CTERM sorting domain-containing protein [Verrucomicrobiae bacterium]
MKRVSTILSLISIFIVSAHGQGFLNLDFESAYDLPGNPGTGTLVSVTNALPDWTVDGGLTDVYCESNILDRRSYVELLGGSLALSGNFSAELFLNSLLSQTGTVPGNAESVEFEAEGPGTAGSIDVAGFSVFLGGQALSYSVLSEGPNYNVYGANIPGDLAGQTEALSFECQGVGSGLVRLDNIVFSPASVPEPLELALMGMGAIVHGLSSRRKRIRLCSLRRRAQGGQESFRLR